jgi:hypothetical protein
VEPIKTKNNLNLSFRTIDTKLNLGSLRIKIAEIITRMTREIMIDKDRNPFDSNENMIKLKGEVGARSYMTINIKVMMRGMIADIIEETKGLKDKHFKRDNKKIFLSETLATTDSIKENFNRKIISFKGNFLNTTSYRTSFLLDGKFS